jgi:hypothetical protein
MIPKMFTNGATLLAINTPIELFNLPAATFGSLIMHTACHPAEDRLRPEERPMIPPTPYNPLFTALIRSSRVSLSSTGSALRAHKGPGHLVHQAARSRPEAFSMKCMALITVPILLVALSTTVLEVCFLVMRIGLSPWAHHYGVWESTFRQIFKIFSI